MAGAGGTCHLFFGQGQCCRICAGSDELGISADSVWLHFALPETECLAASAGAGLRRSDRFAVGRGLGSRRYDSAAHRMHVGGAVPRALSPAGIPRSLVFLHSGSQLELHSAGDPNGSRAPDVLASGCGRRLDHIRRGPVSQSRTCSAEQPIPGNRFVHTAMLCCDCMRSANRQTQRGL